MNILIITYWSYKDALIQTYTLPYLKIIRKYLKADAKIHLFTLEQQRFSISEEELQQIESQLSEYGIVLLRFPYKRFQIQTVLKSPFLIARLVSYIYRHNISILHAWCTPGGALGYLLALVTGKPLYIDSFEPHAQSSVENGDWDKQSLAYRLLFSLEKRMTRKAKKIISTTEGMYAYAQQEYNVKIPRENFFVKPACVNLDIFSPASESFRRKTRESLGIDHNRVVGVYAGKLGGIYLKKEVFELLKVAHSFWNGNFTFLMLTNTPRSEIDHHCEEVGLSPQVVLSKFVKHQEVASYLASGDFGITPVKPIPSKRYCTPIKDGEYWAMGLPVLITKNISDDSEIIEQNKIGAILKDFSEPAYREAIQEIDHLIHQIDRQSLQNQIRNIAIEYRSFSIAEKIYKTIYKK